MRLPGVTHLLIFCKSKKPVKRTSESIIKYIEEKLFLRVNQEKTQVAYVNKIKFLGYGFYIYEGEGQLRIHPKSIQKWIKSAKFPVAAMVWELKREKVDLIK